MDIMETLVEHLMRITFEDLPPEVVSVTKKSVIDTLGVMIAGSSVKGCKLLLDYIKEWRGREDSTIAVFGGKVPCGLADQANGAMARALEIDDVLDIFPLHPSASIIPTCLAGAERQGGISGREFITAVALGHDLVIRMALAIKVSPIVSGRYNLFKLFAFTGSAGKLLRLTEDQLLNAMGIAYSQMVGDGQAASDGAMTSYIQQGTRAKSAIEAALMAQKGITGTRNVLQGQRGFFNAFEPDPNLDALRSSLGVTYKGMEISIKLHSACRATHEAIDLAQTFRKEEINQRQIDQVTVRVNDQCYNLVCQPLDVKRSPKTHVDAQFSIPYTVAATIVRGDVFIDEVSDQAMRDPEILELAQRVTPMVDPECQTDLVVGSTIMEIKTRAGETFVKKAEFPRGNPRNPVSMDECVKKFRRCVNYSAVPFEAAQIEQIVELVNNIEQLQDVSQLSKLLVPNP